MGLDTVELVMMVEEAFDLTISDADAERIRTIGELHRYILGRLEVPIGAASRCLSASTFYRLRRQLMGCLRVERRRIRPAGALEDLIPEVNRRADWDRLGKTLGWDLPPLLRPRWVGRAFLGLVLAWGVALYFALGLFMGWTQEAAVAFFVLFLVGAVPIGGAVYELTRPLAIGFPVADVRGLVPLLLAANLSRIRGPNPEGWTSPQVWDALIAITADLSGVPADQLDESTSFVNDLF